MLSTRNFPLLLLIPPFLLLIPTTSKTLETISVKYSTPISTKLVHQYATKLSWSKARQDTLDDLAEIEKEESEKEGRPMKLITDQVINERAIDERFKGRVSLTKTIGTVVHYELINQMLEQMEDIEDLKFISNWRDHIDEMKLKCYESEEDDPNKKMDVDGKTIQCGCEFNNMLEVVGFGFELWVALRSNLVHDDELNDEDYTDGSSEQITQRIISDESTYEMIISADIVIGKNVDIVVDKVLKRTNQMLVAMSPKVDITTKKNVDVSAMNDEDKRAYIADMESTLRGDKKEEEKKRLEEEARLQEEKLLEKERAMKAENDAKLKNLEADQEKQRVAMRKMVKDIMALFDRKMKLVKQTYTNGDVEKREVLWTELEQIIDNLKRVNVDSLQFDKRTKDSVLARAGTDMEMERYLLEEMNFSDEL